MTGPMTPADRDATGTIRVDLQAEGGQLRVEVLDDGSGLPDGFDIDDTQSLGLSIVRDLVRSQLDGTITMRNRWYGRNGEHGDAGGHRATGPGAAADRPVADDRETGRGVGRGSPGLRVPRAERTGAVERAAAVRLRRPGGGRPARPCASLRRSSSEVAPQTPDSWLVARAKSRQVSWTSQLRQTRLADSIWSTAGPVVPMGKNRSGSVLRQAANCRQSPSSHSTVRFHMRATLIPPLISLGLPSCDLFHIARR